MKLLSRFKKMNRKKKWLLGMAAFLFMIFLLAVVLFMSKGYGLSFFRTAVDLAPGESERSQDYQTLLALAESVLDTDGEVKTYLILFQNNLELRPGGGFIGSFGILKIRDGQLVDLQVHDVVNFDGRIPDIIEPPYPMKETLGLWDAGWKFRDSNFSPDYGENVFYAEKFYKLAGGQEEFDGVVAITTHVLESVLSVTGPVTVAGFPGTYDSENGVLQLEKQVEIDFIDQGLKRGERKAFMKDLAAVILEKVKDLPLREQYRLFEIILADMHAKDVQLLFKDEKLQKIVADSGWDGRMNESWNKDYLFIVDSNMNSFKSDHFIHRSYIYDLDTTVSPAQAKVTVTYNHTAKEKDWLVKDYQTYLRVYLPKGAFVQSVTDSVDELHYGEFLGKKWVGTLQQVALGTSKSVEIQYTLPEEIIKDYDLLIERQPGIKEDTKVTVRRKTNTGTTEKTFVLTKNTKLSEVE